MVSVTHTYWRTETFLKPLKDSQIFTPMAYISKIPRCVFHRECEHQSWSPTSGISQKMGNTD